MTEAEWLASEDPQRMLTFVNTPASLGGRPWSEWKPSDRKLGLIEDAAYERFGLNLDDLVVQSVPPAGAAALLREIIGNPFRPLPPLRGWAHYECKVCGATPDGEGEIRHGKGCYMLEEDGGGSEWAEPWVSPWLTSIVLGIAQSIYDGRDLAALLVLGDALEEAGCPAEVECGTCPVLRKAKVTAEGYYDRDIVQEVIAWGQAKKACRCKGTGRLPNPLLAHLRGPGVHVMGCWALDLLLGYE